MGAQGGEGKWGSVLQPGHEGLCGVVVGELWSQSLIFIFFLCF